jgi:drug/metabolite transporter (DMT)-like permease
VAPRPFRRAVATACATAPDADAFPRGPRADRSVSRDPRLVGIVAAVATIAIWTAFIVVARAMALRSLTPFDIVLCRLLGAATVLLPWGAWIVHRRRARGDAAPSWLRLSPLPARTSVLIGLFGGVGYAVFAYSGFVHAPAAHGSVLLPGMLPLTTALWSVWLLGERPGPGRLAGLALIVGGGALVGGGSLLQVFDGGEVWKGDLMFLTAAACWGLYAVLCRRLRLDPVEGTIAITVFAVATYVPGYLALAAAGLVESRLASAPLGEILFQAVWQGIGSVVISGITFMKMVQAFGPVRSTMLTALVPGLSALGAVAVLGEPLGVHLLVGLGLVTLGIVVGVKAAAAGRA